MEERGADGALEDGVARQPHSKGGLWALHTSLVVHTSAAVEAASADIKGQLERKVSMGVQVLAKGWQAVNGPQGTYYYNAATKETSWEQPLTAAPSKEVAEEDVKTLAKAKAEKEATASRAQTAAEDANNKYQAAVNEEQRLAQAAQAAQGAGQAADEVVGRPVAWSAGRSAYRSVGRSVGNSVGRSVHGREARFAIPGGTTFRSPTVQCAT